MTIKPTLEELSLLSKETHKENQKFFKRLKKKTPKKLDDIVHTIHDEIFEKTDCLSCANCCKTTSPIFTDKDIKRISKHLKMKEIHFIETYLVRDEDDFMVLKKSPCSFLDLNDNTCIIYDFKPKACGEYPHTNRRKFIQLTDLTLKNVEICPAVYNIVEELKKRV